MHLIGITGKARAGKDTVAKYLVRNYGFVTSSFALPLKRAAREMFGLTDAQMLDDEFKEVVIPFWGMSPRTMFQKLGTEGGRMVFGDDLWLKRWEKFYRDYKDTAHIAVSDVRFENEAALIRKLGGTVLHIEGRSNDLVGDTKKHASEMGIKRLMSDPLIVNDSTYDALYAKIDEFMDWQDQRRLHGGDAA